MPAIRKRLPLLCVWLAAALLITGCRGLRRPIGATPTPAVAAGAVAAGASDMTGKGWTLIPTNVTKTAAGDLHVDLAARNDTGTWSAMAALDKPASIKGKDGKSVACDTVKVSSGGHYLPPAFQIRGYTLKQDNKTQTLYVECKGAEASGARLLVEYSYVTGEYDYYAQDKSKIEGQLEADLDKVEAGLTYPVSAPAAARAQALGEAIPALNKCTLTNTGAARTADTVSLGWKVANPGDYDTKVHIGQPPVVGSDGVLYGVRVSPDIVDQPFSPGKGAVDFKTEVAVPKDVTGLYLLLSVEQSRERLFANYLIDLTGLK